MAELDSKYCYNCKKFGLVESSKDTATCVY